MKIGNRTGPEHVERAQTFIGNDYTFQTYIEKYGGSAFCPDDPPLSGYRPFYTIDTKITGWYIDLYAPN